MAIEAVDESAPEPTATGDAADLAAAGFERLRERPPQGLVRRAWTTTHHLVGLSAGALVDVVRTRPAPKRRGLRFRGLQLLSALCRPWIDRTLVHQPFPVQFRRRLEMLGPTYIKLGQVLSLRRDLLPRAVTDELQNLLDQLPAVTFDRFKELVAEGLGGPAEELFDWIESRPTGSASIAQIHRAATLDGASVIIKVVKPGIRETLARDARLLHGLGLLLQVFFRRYQPRRVIDELTAFTLREADLRLEADNAETFAANFRDQPDIVFPRILRALSSDRVLTMEFFAGFRPDARAAQRLTQTERDRIIDLGAAAIIRMIYRDGFFHADLHPGNLLVLKGPKAGFIDLGMVGRLEEETRRTLLYYYYSLTLGDAPGAARYLTLVAEPLRGADADGFRRAVEDVSRRWQQAANFRDFSLGQLIVESIALGGQFRMRFPVEMVLMVKALVTFEGVGNVLKPGFDIADVSRGHVVRVFLESFSPAKLAQLGVRNAPELLEAAAKTPLLITEGLRLLEQTTRQPTTHPLAGIRGTILGGFCLVAGAILAAGGAPWQLTAAVFAVGLLVALR